MAIGCKQPQQIIEIDLIDLNGQLAQIVPTENAITVVYFLSPECPLCINYTLALRKMSNQFSSDSIVFYGVHSGEWFSAEELEEYQLKYSLSFEMFLDNGNQLAQNLGATVTPEVFVLNSKSEIIYSGKIDNWVNDLGKKKLEVSEHYLEDALTAFLKGKPINQKETTPIGCLIE
jgi:peroxiredoxin